MKNAWTIQTTLITGLLAASGANADITISQPGAGTTYATTLDFDEAGGPTGVVPTNSWASLGLSIMDAGDAVPQVGDFGTTVGPWIGTGNSFLGNFGVFMTFDNDLTNFSGQFWDPSGPPSPFGGGLAIFVFNDGAQVADLSVTPSWGGVGDPWIDISATGGMVFDEVRILGFGFDPTTYADNLSWNQVPTPSTLALLGLGGITLTRRRR